MDILQFMEFVDIPWDLNISKGQGNAKYVRYNEVSLHCMEVLFRIFNYHWGEEYSKNLRLRMWFLRTC